MTEERFTVNYRENTRLYEVKDNLHILDCGGFAIEYNAKKCCEELNALHEENIQLKNSLKEFEVFESDRIKGAVVTNNKYSVTLHNNNEAYMVCNMLNRFIRSVKNGSKD